MVEQIDRGQMKAEIKELLRGAQVNSKRFTALYLLLCLLLTTVDSFAGGSITSLANPLEMFVTILTTLLAQVLTVGFILYAMMIRRNERAEYLTLFDGFSFAGRVIGLAIVEYFFITLWSLLFFIPGIVAAYRYRFAYYNLCENPEMGCMDALELSKKQTMGYKQQLFELDLSYLGWILLSVLPSVIWSTYVINSTLNTLGGNELLFAASPISTSVNILVQLLCGLWMLFLEVFYIPVYQCTELGYYEVAKRTSGVTPTLEDLPTDRPEIGDGDDSFF